MMKVETMDLDSVNKLMDEIAEDRTVPRNIRTMLQQAKADLNDEKNDWPVRINAAISILDEVSNDPNIPIYARTQIWNIVSLLEVINEEAKKQ
jgi:hypothetical protein